MSNSTAVLSPESIKKIQDVMLFCESKKVISITVRNETEFQGAGEVLKELKKLDKEIDAIYRSEKDPIVKKGREIDEAFRNPKAVIYDKIASISKAITNYTLEQRRIQAEKQAAAERAARLEQEKYLAKAREEEEKAAANRESNRNTVADRQELRAADLMQKAAEVKVEPVAVEAPKIQGVSVTTTWYGEVIDKTQFCSWCIQSGNYHFLKIDESALNAQAKACKGEMKIPGVRWFTKETTRTRI